MALRIDSFLNVFRRQVPPTKWAGAPGFASYAGYVVEEERDRSLLTHEERHKTYTDILSNTSIVAASVRYYLNLIGKAEWSFEKAEGDTSDEYVERLEEILMADPATSWHRIVRRAAVHRFYGFSLQEWLARRRPDGWLTLADVRPRPQATITQWDTDLESGLVLGAVQLRPQDSQYLYLPRGKLLYMVDDALTDRPMGLGIFRHLVSPAARLRRYEQLEGYGFELDLRNVPIGRAPLERIGQAVAAGELTKEEASKLIEPIRQFCLNHIRDPKLAALLESEPYATEDEAGRPSTTRKFDIELLSGSQTSLEQVNSAIERINRELGRILGTEQLLLGDGEGSYALSRDKTSQFYLLVDSSLVEVREQVEKDLVDPIWQLNGWPDELKPTLKTEAVRSRDIQEITASLRDMATAGAVLLPDDPVIGEVRDLMGMSRPVEDSDFNRLLNGMVDDPNNPEDPVNPPEGDPE